MANDFTKNPYKVDTVMAATLRNTVGAVFGPGALNIQRILWVGPVSVGDKYNIDSDIAGSPVDHAACQVAGVDVDHEFGPSGVDCFDFKLTVKDSGTLYIFLY